MKTILRIIMILLVAAIVAGAFFLAANNNLTASTNGSQPPSITSNSGQQFTRPEDSDHDGGSGAGGVLGTLLKITGITILVLMLQKAWSQLGSLKLKFEQP